MITFWNGFWLWFLVANWIYHWKLENVSQNTIKYYFLSRTQDIDCTTFKTRWDCSICLQQQFPVVGKKSVKYLYVFILGVESHIIVILLQLTIWHSLFIWHFTKHWNPMSSHKTIKNKIEYWLQWGTRIFLVAVMLFKPVWLQLVVFLCR